MTSYQSQINRTSLGQDTCLELMLGNLLFTAGHSKDEFPELYKVLSGPSSWGSWVLAWALSSSLTRRSNSGFKDSSSSITVISFCNDNMTTKWKKMLTHIEYARNSNWKLQYTLPSYSEPFLWVEQLGNLYDLV